MIANIAPVAAALLGGILLSGLYFGGLWWTVRRAKRGGALASWLMTSFAFRSALLLLGLWWIGAGQAVRMIAAAAGFFIGRAIIAGWARSGRATGPSSQPGR